jgi:uncharacterized protein YbaR (Trm112 family)
MTEDRQFARPQPTLGTASANSRGGIEPWLMGLLTCPVDCAHVRPDGSELVCDSCGRHYSGCDQILAMTPADLKGEHKF